MNYEFYVLVVTAFLTSALSSVLGMGGGIVLLTVMLSFFPPAICIPLHGSAQLFSNGFRVFLNYKWLHWGIAGPLLIGGLLGGPLAGFFVQKIQFSNYYSVALALFILTFTWLPKAKKGFQIPFKFYILGFISHFLSLVIGATGPVLAPFFLNINLNRFQIIATKALAQFSGHLFKVLFFLYTGFAFIQHIQIILGLIGATLLGTYAGKKVLNKISEKYFLVGFKVIITVLSIRILVTNL